jgi:hypothetical protein
VKGSLRGGAGGQSELEVETQRWAWLCLCQLRYKPCLLPDHSKLAQLRGFEMMLVMRDCFCAVSQLTRGWILPILEYICGGVGWVCVCARACSALMPQCKHRLRVGLRHTEVKLRMSEVDLPEMLIQWYSPQGALQLFIPGSVSKGMIQ